MKDYDMEGLIRLAGAVARRAIEDVKEYDYNMYVLNKRKNKTRVSEIKSKIRRLVIEKEDADRFLQEVVKSKSYIGRKIRNEIKKSKLESKHYRNQFNEDQLIEFAFSSDEEKTERSNNNAPVMADNQTSSD